MCFPCLCGKQIFGVKCHPSCHPKGWKESARWLEKRKKKSNWLGPFWKSSIFVPPTPGSELKKQMQAKEEEMRAGGREAYPKMTGEREAILCQIG